MRNCPGNVRDLIFFYIIFVQGGQVAMVVRAVSVARAVRSLRTIRAFRAFRAVSGGV